MQNIEINHYIYSISEIKKLISNDSYFYDYFREQSDNFFTESNPKIADYLKNKALQHEQEGSIRTYLIVNIDNLEVIGYFCLKIVNVKFMDEVSSKLRKKISKTADKNGEFPTILITKLARNDLYKNVVDGKVIMEYALSIAEDVYQKIALRHVCVDWYESECLFKFYCEKCEFKKFQENHKNGEEKLISAFYKF